MNLQDLARKWSRDHRRQVFNRTAFAMGLLVAACGTGATGGGDRRADKSMEAVILRSGRAVYFRGDRTHDRVQELSHCEPDTILAEVNGGWTATTAIVERVDQDVTRELDVALARVFRDRPRRPSASSYYRQYVGVRSRGRKLLLINGFHERFLDRDRAILKELRTRGDTAPLSLDDWKRSGVDICDAGAGQFRTYYNPATHRFSQIRFSMSLAGPIE